MSDLTPEETLQAEYYDESEPYQGRHVPLSSALAAVAAERERTRAEIVKLLRDEADLALRMDATHAPAGRAVYDTLRFAASLVAREGDTT